MLGIARRLALLVTAATLVAAVPAPGVAAARDAPAQWDRRLRRFVRFVERERRLDFEHPVRVRFLRDAAFERALRAGEEEPTTEDLEFDEQLAGELVAIGLAAERGSTEAARAEADAGTVGFYDSETDELVIRGTDVDDIEVRVTVVHELTHALQDQHFDLNALYDAAKDSSAATALDFLVEGDATAVETTYLDSLSSKALDEYYADLDVERAEATVAGVPYVYEVFASTPYVLGEAYVYALDPEGGTRGRDRAFADPPTTEEVLIDPVALRRDEPARKVPAPRLREGEKKAYDPDSFGVMTIYLMLATRLDAQTALEAVTGWGGDRYVSFERDGAACIRLGVTGDARRDTRQLEAALTAWAATMPPTAATVERDGAIVTLTTCEVAGVTEPAMEVLDRVVFNVLAGRIYTVLDLASYGIPLRDARCMGDAVSTAPDVVAVYDRVLAEGSKPTKEEQAVVDDAYTLAASTCGIIP